jgi:DNA-binding NtrC family response regulator
VRELENAMERAVVLADGPEIGVRDLPAEVRETGLAGGLIRDSARSFHASVEEYKRGLIVSALRRAGGNRTHAARMLGLQRTYLSRIIRDLGLGPADETESEAPAAAGPLAIASE